MSRIVPKTKKTWRRKSGEKKIADRQMNGKFVSIIERKRRDTASRHFKSFIMETEDKKLTLVVENLVLRRYVTQKRDGRSIPTPS